MRACTASSTVIGRRTLARRSAMDRPFLVLGELVLDLEHAHVVEDADHLLEQRGVPARERASPRR